jgi:archaemetzincin
MDIFLVPIEFSNVSLLKLLQSELSSVLQCRVSLLDLPVNINSGYSREREQYFSTMLIADAIKYTENIEGKILLLTEFDLYVPVFTFVFGEAQLMGKHAIVSVCRLHEEFYTGVTNEKLLFERSMKEILHELGHTFGLIHCKNWDCVMHSSMGVEEVDLKGAKYCERCEELIKKVFFRINPPQVN